MPLKHVWVDHARKLVFDTDNAACPPGCAAFKDGTLPSGYTRDGSHMMLDSAAPGSGGRVTMHDTADVALTDAAGHSHLLRDHASINDALAACPPDTRDLQRKVAQTLLMARDASGGAFGNHADNLREFSRQYRGRAFSATEQSVKDAYNNAAQSIDGTVAALTATRA